MKSALETNGKRDALVRRQWIAVASLLLVLTLAVMAEGVSAAKSPPRTWRERAAGYLAQTEYLLFPHSGAGARLDFDLGEELVSAP